MGCNIDMVGNELWICLNWVSYGHFMGLHFMGSHFMFCILFFAFMSVFFCLYGVRAQEKGYRYRPSFDMVSSWIFFSQGGN